MYLVCNFVIYENYFYLILRCQTSSRSLDMYCICIYISCSMFQSMHVLISWIRHYHWHGYSWLYLPIFSFKYVITSVPLIPDVYFLTHWTSISIILYISIVSLFQYTTSFIQLVIGPYHHSLCTLISYVPWHMLFVVHTSVDLLVSQEKGDLPIV